VPLSANADAVLARRWTDGAKGYVFGSRKSSVRRLESTTYASTTCVIRSPPGSCSVAVRWKRFRRR